MTSREHLIQKYGSKEAVSQHYREMQKKSQITRDGRKAAQTLIKNNGEDYFRELGRKGGKSGKK